MDILALLGVILAISAIIYLTTKNLHVVLAAPLASLVVILTNQMDILDSLLGKEQSYMVGLTGFLINNFAIFLLGSILASYMEKSGASQSIAQAILKLVGKDKPFSVLLAITIVASILTYGGVSIFVVIFTLLPLSRPLFKELNINWELFPIPVFLGASTYTLTALPATPSIQNAIPTKVLGTSLTAAPVLGILASLTMLVFGLCYMSYALKKSLKKGETYMETGDSESDISESNQQLPSLFVSCLPLLGLLATIFVFSKMPNILVVGLTISILLSALLFKPFLPNQKEVLNAGTTASIIPAFATSSTVAFGAVLTASTGFSLIQAAIRSIPGSPLISLSLSTALLSGILGSASGAIGIVSANFLPSYLEMGIQPELLHRVTVIASAALTVVPQSGVMITFHNLSKLSMKRALKHSFIIVNGGHILALIVILLAAHFLY
ncbi:GntP family permease [Streptococcus oriscaviae]|uniref:GntP family permease n=1 Tax=Streptococcus oriscaviae TaxID=2781599 RepID=A0ABX7YKM3_9STRE|nr:GntP family permease [Streptococcus oriscaviae]QUE54218.1 GntP family permease [Streptococcus oriscaviae]